MSDENSTDQFRAICVHGNAYSQIWRGPIRSTYVEADNDLQRHTAVCGHTNNGIINPGDPNWE